MLSQLEERISRVISLCERGNLCNAETWTVIANHLAGADVEATLNQFCETTQQALAALPTYSINLNVNPSETRRAIYAWCLRKSDDTQRGVRSPEA